MSTPLRGERHARRHFRLLIALRRRIIRLRAHDLRASFITVNLAAGKTEAWITDRTGHKSSVMVYAYKRPARSHAELNLGGFAPLHESVPELQRLGST